MSTTEDAAGLKVQTISLNDYESSQMPAMISILTKLSDTAETQSQIMHRTEAILEKLLVTMNVQNQQAGGALGNSTVNAAEASEYLHNSVCISTPQREMAINKCDKEDGKKWPEDREYFNRRLNYYEEKWNDVSTELRHLEMHYDRVGGDRGVIKASLHFRTALLASISAARDVNLSDYRTEAVETLKKSASRKRRKEGLELESSLRYNYREAVIRFKKKLDLTATEFHESLYGQKHAFYFRKMGECCDILKSYRFSYLKDDDLIPAMLDNVFYRMEMIMQELVAELQAFRDKALPVFLTEEKERITNRYLNITTIATFFSSVTATALAISLQTDNDPMAYAAVNLFWFVSLVFSVSSGVSSLVGMLWHNSRVFYSSAPPQSVKFWFERSPMVSLIIAALTFIIGLNIYVYVSAQAHFVSCMTSIFTGLHVLGLFPVVMWFACHLYKERRWARFLLKTVNLLSSRSKILRVFIMSGVKAQYLRAKVVYEIMEAPYKNSKAAYENNLHLRRNINWAFRQDNRVALMNVTAAQDTQPGTANVFKPYWMAKVVRTMTIPVKFSKDCKRWTTSISQNLAGRSLAPLIEGTNQTDIEMTGSMLRASQMPWMTEFRMRLNRTFGSIASERMMEEIDRIDWIVQYNSDETRSHQIDILEELFWGYQGFLEKFRDTCLPNLRQCCYLHSGSLSVPSEFSADVYPVQDGNKKYMMKVSRVEPWLERERDIYIKMKVNHRNVLALLGTSRNCEVAIGGKTPSLFFPFMENGNLSQFIQCGSQYNAASLLLEISHGIQHLHSLDIIHTDIWPGNVLIDGQGHPKLSSLGRARVPGFSSPLERERDLSSHPMPYIAPEILTATNANEDPGFTKEGDVYSFAYLCFEVYSRARPYAKYGLYRIVQEIRNGRRPDRPEAHGLTNDVWALIELCWAQDPDERPEIDLVVEALALIHPEKRDSPAP